jgi:hypothetical protein
LNTVTTCTSDHYTLQTMSVWLLSGVSFSFSLSWTYNGETVNMLTHLPSIHLPCIHLPSIHLPSIHLPCIHLTSIHLPCIHLTSIHPPCIHLTCTHLLVILSRKMLQLTFYSLLTPPHNAKQASPTTLLASMPCRGRTCPFPYLALSMAPQQRLYPQLEGCVVIYFILYL